MSKKRHDLLSMTPTQIRATRQWRLLSEQVRREEPACRVKLEGCTGRADTVDHIIPLIERPDLAFTRANLRGACASCNTTLVRVALGWSDARPVSPPAPALAYFDV